MAIYAEDNLVPYLALPEPGHIIMRPGKIIGRGLAVAEVVPPAHLEIKAWSITAVPTGRMLPYAVFFNFKLAVRCAREIARRANFEHDSDEDLHSFYQQTKYQWEDHARPILETYLELDDMWCARQPNAAYYGVQEAR